LNNSIKVLERTTESLQEILERAKEFHGHLCPFVALGVKASIIAMDEIGVQRLDVNKSIEESVIAVVECNNCFVDGVQVTIGCTLGNNSLIYFDLGKNALSLVKRNSWKGVRVYIDAENLRERYFSKEAIELFEKVIVKRQGDEEDRQRLSQLWEEIGYKMLKIPKEEFKVERVKIEQIEQAPIFKSVRCSSCNELVMETRVVYVSEGPYCLSCAGKSYHAVIGRGIVEIAKGVNK